MTEKTIQTTTGRRKIRMPENLSEMSIGQLAALQEKPEMSDLEVISLLSDIPLPDLMNAKNTHEFNIFIENIHRISAQILELFRVSSVPDKITFHSGLTLQVPSDLATEPAGAFMAARDIIGDEISQFIQQHGEEERNKQYNPSVKSCCYVLAHYFYCKATGNPYDEYKAEAFVEEVKKLSVAEALPVSGHFFSLLSQLIETENKLLSTATSAIEKKAGIQAFEKFKYINTVNALAGGDITKWQAILNMPYERVLTKLLLNKTEAEYQRRYSELVK